MQSMTLEQLRTASEAGGVSSVTLKGQGGVFFVQIATRNGSLTVLAKAREDLRGIVRYLGKDNPTRARSFVGQELRDKTLPLAAQHPEPGRSGRPGLPAKAGRTATRKPHSLVIW